MSRAAAETDDSPRTADAFAGLAVDYDRIMRDVDYDRWYVVASGVASILPRPMRHLDVACGTCKLLKKCWAAQWQSFGMDLSRPMLRAGIAGEARRRVAVADLRALPFAGSYDYITCLFDSLNFLITVGDMRAGVASMARALRPSGILYFDIITERMVLDHFAGQKWTERQKGFAATWSCEYDSRSSIAAITIRVNKGTPFTLYERVYSLDEVEDAVRAAGMRLLAVVDAETWTAPRPSTVRVDFVAVKGDTAEYARAFRGVRAELRKIFV